MTRPAQFRSVSSASATSTAGGTRSTAAAARRTSGRCVSVRSEPAPSAPSPASSMSAAMIVAPRSANLSVGARLIPAAAVTSAIFPWSTLFFRSSLTQRASHPPSTVTTLPWQ